MIATIQRKEVDSFRADFEVDTIPLLLASVTATVRSYVVSNGTVRVDPDETTIPESCVAAAMDYAVYRLLKRHDKKINEDRETAAMNALTFLRDVAANKIRVEDFGAPAADPAKQVATAPEYSEPKPARLLD